MNDQTYALITGASGGIGEELAYCFAQDGFATILVARNKTELERVQTNIKQNYNIDALIYPTDLSVSKNVHALHDWTQREGLTVGCLINNAGFGDNVEVVDADQTRLDTMITLNISALVTLSKLYATDMKAAGNGSIANIASLAALVPGPGMAVYYASKSFVLNFSQALAQELMSYNISVTTICPGATETNFAKAAHAEDSPLFNHAMPSAQTVAVFSYDAIQRGELVAIWGWKNRILAKIISLAPRRVVLRSVHKIQS